MQVDLTSIIIIIDIIIIIILIIIMIVIFMIIIIIIVIFIIIIISSLSCILNSIESQADIAAHLIFKEEQKGKSQQTPIFDSLPLGATSTPIILYTPTKNQRNESYNSPKSETDKRSGVIQTPISNKRSPFSPRTLLRSVSESDIFNRNIYIDIDMDLSRYEDDHMANETSNTDDADMDVCKPSMKPFIRTR